MQTEKLVTGINTDLLLTQAEVLWIGKSYNFDIFQSLSTCKEDCDASQGCHCDWLAEERALPACHLGQHTCGSACLVKGHHGLHAKPVTDVIYCDFPIPEKHDSRPQRLETRSHPLQPHHHSRLAAVVQRVCRGAFAAAVRQMHSESQDRPTALPMSKRRRTNLGDNDKQ